ncbi:phosphopantetheine-binding protein (plasmid) [Pantoea sp. BJ2]|uniref:Phosphopantetheine-binding protein n=1 Tax=Pantoea sp. BJ2 TaxID=3141322 RepID=A0AAU7U3J0_9GAMM
MSNIHSSVTEIVSKCTCVKDILITGETLLIHDLQMDSMNLTEMMCLLEEEFSIEINESDLDDMRSINDIVDFIGLSGSRV